jgi:protein-S-isoprenylcysteine O-methyltransferase Ste14
LQTLLLAAIGVAGFVASWPPGAVVPLRVAAIVPGVGGALLSAGGFRGLGPALTPFPRPVPGAALVDRGAYGIVRHPIYGGVLLLALAWSLATSPLALVPVLALAVVFEGKRRVEESWLVEAVPGYPAYRERVPRRFVPLLW